MSNTIPKDAHVMIIGAMKCGTSSLYDYLSGHPQICPSITKEPEFFSENQGHGVDVENYNDLFPFDGSIHKYTLDGSTGYTKYPAELDVPKKIHNYGISPKFIYIIRNPFDRIQSHFNFMQKDEKWTLDVTSKHLINTCDYFLQLEQYKQYFPESSILLLDFDDLKTNPSGVLERIYDFLNLPHNYFPNGYDVKNQTRNISSFEKRIRALKLDKCLHYLPRVIKDLLKSTIIRLSPTDKRTRTLTEAERKLIFNQLKGSMCDLRKIYGFDTEKWGF